MIFAHLNLQVSHACCTLVIVRGIVRGSNYLIRSLWTFSFIYLGRGGEGGVGFGGKKGARFEVVR